MLCPQSSRLVCRVCLTPLHKCRRGRIRTLSQAPLDTTSDSSPSPPSSPSSSENIASSSTSAGKETQDSNTSTIGELVSQVKLPHGQEKVQAKPKTSPRKSPIATLMAMTAKADRARSPSDPVLLSRRLRSLEQEEDNTPIPSAPRTLLRLPNTSPSPLKVSRLQRTTSPSPSPITVTPFSPFQRTKYIMAQIMKESSSPTSTKRITAVRGAADEPAQNDEDLPAEGTSGHVLGHGTETGRLRPEDIKMVPVQPLVERPVPTLEHGLDRVLFNPGVYFLRDPRSLVYNFDPYLEHIMPANEFDYDALYEFITSSRDKTLLEMASKCGASYVGSTSSMTSVLAHFHYLLSFWRPVNISMLSTAYIDQFSSFSAITRAPITIFLRYRGNGIYAIDAGKMFEKEESVLSFLGRSMEKMLTLPREHMEKYRKELSHTLQPRERGQPEAYHYTQCGGILMRSQLDCHDSRLPGSGVFDLKTRACITVRMDLRNISERSTYEIHHLTGKYNSFEREYYDMIRSAFLKYSLQVRIGNMDGIFVTYHNTNRIFGFQYISLEELDLAIHGSREDDIGRREFHFSTKLFNEALDLAVKRFPEQSLRMVFETRETKVPMMYVIAEPYGEDEIEAIQNGEYMRALRLAEEQERQRARSTPTEDKPPECTASNTETTAESAAETTTETTTEATAEATTNVTTDATSDVTPDAASDVTSTETPMSTDSVAETNNSDLPQDPLLAGPISETEKLQNPTREILGMVLRTHNHIDGIHIVGPPKITANNKWEVTYRFETIPEDRARKLLEKMLDRQRKAFDEDFREHIFDETAAGERNRKWRAGFQKTLTDLSLQGARWRKAFESKNKGRKKVIWKQGSPSQTNFESAARKEETLEDTST